MIATIHQMVHGADTTRTVIALAFTAAMIYGFVVGRIGADVFVATASLAIGFFFNKAGGTTNGHGGGASS